MLKKIFFPLLAFFIFANFAIAETIPQNQKKINLIIFERDDCQHCQNLNNFLNSEKFLLFSQNQKISIQKINIQKTENVENFKKFSKKYNLPQVTPITLIGNSIIVGFDSSQTTGYNIQKKITKALTNQKFNLNLQYYLSGDENTNIDNSNPTCGETSQECKIDIASQENKNKVEIETQKKFSFFGKEINIKNMGLFSVSIILGTLDGFNPCAMWVLFTFLIALSQIGSKKKMVQIVGLFIMAESIMYFLILNIWYQAWDFIKLDSIITPIIGVFSVASGLYFLWKYLKTKDELTCDVTSTEHQAKISTKIQDLAQKPLTWAVAVGIILIAFSVNIIEFACSVGIVQTYTKILEINNLNFLTQQFYTLIYTLGYMADDFIVFSLAIWGYKSFYTFGAKSSKYSTLFAGILMIFLGVLLIFFKNFLVF